MLRKTLSFPLKLLNSLTFKLLTDDKLQQVSYVPQVHTMVKCSLCKIKTGFRFFNTFYKIFKLMVINNIIITCSSCYNFYFYVAGIEVLVGSLLYKYQHKEIFSILAKDPKNEYPTEKL